ncbi:MAG: hypothetical protein M1820_003119 [Bogoriella megaspora]|nr:MAG: hypothetical protein M1820_003119 [Bogoriella megaspora]
MSSGGIAVLNGYNEDKDSGYGSEKDFGGSTDYRRSGPSPGTEDLPRPASYTFLPQTQQAAIDIKSLKGSFTESELIPPDAADIVESEKYYSSGGSSPEKEADTLLGYGDKTGTREGANIKVSSSLSSPNLRGVVSGTEESHARSVNVPVARKASESGKKLKKTWIVGSRSSSPTKAPAQETGDGRSAPPSPAKAPRLKDRRMSLRRRDSSKPAEIEKQNGKQDEAVINEVEMRPGLERKGTFRKASRPLSLLLSGSSDKNGDRRPPIPSLPKSFSSDRLPTLSSPPVVLERVPPLPRLTSSEKAAKSDMPRKKDELWNSFRTLDGEYQKFQSKSIALKTNVIRSSLLPFLRDNLSNTSHRGLRPEDLDRRCNILNKWWTGLLDMIQGKNNQSISGTDRPVVLEAIAGIMERPEWRSYGTPFCPLNDRYPPSQTPRNKSATSLLSESSDFLAESVYHNVRNTFVQNLTEQMILVVDRMCLRNASASLVSFCGKACAYAFFFCPGLADILIRLWHLPVNSLKRVVNEGERSKQGPAAKDLSSRIASGFPPSVQHLAFTSVNKTMRALRSPTPIPVRVKDVNWHGYWVSRWAGKESDLFYVFAKHFHILLTDYLPQDTDRYERLCAPGMALVQAQMLNNLDSTIHRQAAQLQIEGNAGASSITFDDVFSDPDAQTPALPMLPANATRLMAENRLIMLIRDFLSERSSHIPAARHVFAESFNDVLKASARGISLYDHKACYTLCDFLEEAIFILVRYDSMSHVDDSVLDWPFWLDVFRQMVASQNTMTEIRLYAFFYSCWGTITSDSRRQRETCVNFLMEPSFFDGRFNHWCPMVRAYFMRLLCWRVARYDYGHESRTEVLMLDALMERLLSVWSHYTYLKEQAEANGEGPPLTIPSNPAPHRRLDIARTDTQVGPATSFMAFDGLLDNSHSPPSPLSPANKRDSTFNLLAETGMRTFASLTSRSEQPPESGNRGKWSLFKNLINPSKSRSRSQSPSPARKPKDDQGKENLKQTQSATLEASNPLQPSPLSADAALKIAGATAAASNGASNRQPQIPTITDAAPPHRPLCFKFSLDWVTKSNALPQSMRLYAPHLPTAAQDFLQQHSAKANSPLQFRPVEPKGEQKLSSRYAGRALAEWQLVTGEYEDFVTRRINQGMPADKVETPVLGVETFRRPG